MRPYPEQVLFMGPMKPQRFEATVQDCIVEGEIPVDLNGGFYRCGPTWKRETVQGVTGFSSRDGMIQGLIFENGKVNYLNRWVHSPKYLLEEKHGKALFEWHDAWSDWRGYGQIPKNEFGTVTHGVPGSSPIVNVVPFHANVGDEILALAEQGLAPMSLNPRTLETNGMVEWAGQLSAGMDGHATFTAHPKWDPDTGEVFGWTYRDTKPYVTMHFVQPDGTVKTRDLDDAPYATNAHDAWLTEKYLVLPFQPFYASLDRVMNQNLSFLGWNPELPTMLAFIPRGLDGDIRWIKADFPTEYIMHTMSANEIDGKIILDGPIFDRAPFPFEDEVGIGEDFVPFGAGVIGRWIVDLDAERITTERLDERPVEFPKIDERFYGKPYNYGFLVSGPNLFMLDTLIKRNVITGEEEICKLNYEQAFAIFEPTFVPRSADAAEGDGYLIAPVSLYMDNLSEYVIIDTANFSAGPIARIQIPFQIGWTPHGHWMNFRK